MCGIFGIVSNKSVAQKIPLGLYDLQHRGEQGAGMAVSDGKEIQEHKEAGLVTEIFHEERMKEISRECKGNSGVGQTLYSTIGRAGEEKQPKAYQPLLGNFHGEVYALCHNGNLVKLDKLRKEAKERGYKFQSEASDTEAIVGLLSTSQEKDFLEALLKVLPRLKGAFALTILFEDKVIGVRDSYGIRPLCLGRDENSFILASEESAFHTIRADSIREIEPGEIIVLGKNGIEKSFIWAENPQLRICLFEYIYFARPDSRIAGQRVNTYRGNAGREVALEHPVEADIICSVPESGEVYNYGVSQILGIPVDKAIFRNRYFATRTFMASREIDRRSLQRIKFYILREVVHGRRVVITEDSILRGNVAPEIVAMLREAGAIEVHVRVGSSPIRWPCFLGVDLVRRGELVAASLTEEEVGRKIVRADSLGYLSLGGMLRALGLPRENLCLGCFTGEYPVEPPPGFLS